eukprot:COSAG02_NODE_3215_length_7161_cov_57.637638_1_plen_212_part_00
MSVDGDLALAHMLDRENSRPAHSTRRRTQEQALPQMQEPWKSNADHDRTKRQKPRCQLDSRTVAERDVDEGSSGVSTRAVPLVEPTLVDSANRPVPTFAWPGTDSDFPCLPEATDGRQRLLWEAELIGSHVMLLCANVVHTGSVCYAVTSMNPTPTYPPVPFLYAYVCLPGISLLTQSCVNSVEASGRLQLQMTRLSGGRTNTWMICISSL